MISFGAALFATLAVSPSPELTTDPAAILTGFGRWDARPNGTYAEILNRSPPLIVPAGATIILLIISLPNEFAEDGRLLQYDFEASIGYWLTVATQAYHRELNEELAPHGITYRQAQVLGWLALEGELSQTELAARMMVEPPTLVGILDRMERDGWVSRTCCESDRRKKLVGLRPEAEPIWAKIIDCAAQVRARASAGLSPDELETLKNLLGRIQANLAGQGVESDEWKVMSEK